MVDRLLTILVNQICRLFSTHQTPDSIIAPFTVRHPPSKIPNSCKTNRLMLYIGFSYTNQLGNQVKHLLIILSILLLSSPLFGQETGVLYQYETSLQR